VADFPTSVAVLVGRVANGRHPLAHSPVTKPEQLAAGIRLITYFYAIVPGSSLSSYMKGK